MVHLSTSVLNKLSSEVLETVKLLLKRLSSRERVHKILSYGSLVNLCFKINAELRHLYKLVLKSLYKLKRLSSRERVHSLRWFSEFVKSHVG